MTRKELTTIGERLAEDLVDQSGEVNTTLLAENIAHEAGHDEWLDDETHLVWEVACDIGTHLEEMNALCGYDA